MKKVLLLILTLLATSGLFAQTFTDNGINYTVTSPTTVEVAPNPAFIGGALIPSSVNYASVVYNVTAIGERAFWQCTGLTSVNIPNSIISIYYQAFGSCENLTSLNIPNSVTFIGILAFADCTRISSLSISNSLTNIATQAFAGCQGLTSLSIPNSVTNIGEGGFRVCNNLKTLILPNSVTSVGINAFEWCTSLTSAIIPKSVTSINERAFALCSNLKSVTVTGDSPLSINANVFNGVAVASATLYIPAGTLAAYKAAPVWKDFGTITEMDPLIFTDNGIYYTITSPTTVEVGLNPNFAGAAVIPNTVSYNGLTYNVTSIGDSAFSNNIPSTLLTSISIPNSVTSIGTKAFSFCNGLTSLNIPTSLTTIGTQAFSFCGNLASLNIPNSVSSIESRAFEYCTSLTSINIPNSITEINNGVFSYCTKLASVNIPNSVTNIGDYAFNSCYGLKSVNIPTSVKSIGDWAFGSCNNLLEINIPNTVTSIGNNAFQDCSSLSSVNIPNSVKTIGIGAFYNCSGLKSVIIPNSITSIGINAFQNCSVLTTVTVNWIKPLVINANIFNNVPIASDTLYVPFGTLAAYNAAPVWKIFGTIIEMQPITFTYQGINFKVTSPTTIEITATPTFMGVLSIPSSITYEGITYDVTSIANNAFAGTDITTINIPSTVINIGDYAFANLTGLTTVTVNWTTPLTINANVFGDVPIIQAIGYKPNRTLMSNKVITAVSGNTNLANATLFVPATTENAYRSALVWKDFGTITASPLPLTLTKLTAKAISTGNQVNWSTADIINVKNITLERSAADNNFSPLIVLPVTAVQYIDINPLPGDNYYRLSSTDNDGTTQTYPLIAFVKGLSKEVSFYPNPVSNGILNVVAGSYKIESVALFDMNGKKVVFVNAKSNPQNLAIPTQGLAKGVYVLEIKGENNSTTKKVVVD